jgi:hypothetical protein
MICVRDHRSNITPPRSGVTTRNLLLRRDDRYRRPQMAAPEPPRWAYPHAHDQAPNDLINYERGSEIVSCYVQQLSRKSTTCFSQR